MIDFYTYGTFNGKAVKIVLEATEQNYESHKIDLQKAEQHSLEYLAINPSGRIPCIVDHEVEGSLTISQTAAIIIYLAEKSGKFLCDEVKARARTLQWVQFLVTDIGTNIFNNFHLKSLVSPKQPKAGEMLKQRALHFCLELETQLLQTKYLNGVEVSIADMIAIPMIDFLFDDLEMDMLPGVNRWYQVMCEYEFTRKGLAM